MRPLEEIREAMGRGGALNVGGTPTRATCRRTLALFSTVTDPRQAGKARYPLNEVLLLAFFAVMCDENTWVGMEGFGHDRLRWLRRFSPSGAACPRTTPSAT